MRQIVVFDTDDLVKLLKGEEITMSLNNGTKLTVMNDDRFNKMLHYDSTDSIHLSKMDIQSEGGENK